MKISKYKKLLKILQENNNAVMVFIGEYDALLTKANKLTARNKRLDTRIAMLEAQLVKARFKTNQQIFKEEK